MRRPARHTPRRLHALSLALTAATLALGTTSGAEPPPTAVPVPAETLAVDPLDDPALGRRTILAEGFAPARPPRLGALRSAACDLTWRSDGKGPALRYERRAPYRCGLLVAATPSTLYLIERQLATAAPGVDLVVVETRYPLLDRNTPNEAQDVARLLSKRWVRRDALVAIHRFRRTPAVAGWEHGTTLFTTTPATRSLVLLVADQELEAATPPVTALFDDLRVDVLDPTPEQAAALSPRMDVGPGDTGSGPRHPDVVASATPPASADPPNVVLITVGGLRADRLGLAGYPRPTSPNLDSLARRAVVFETAVSPGNASRLVMPSLLTGLPPAALGLTNPARELASGIRTLAERLAERGLVSAAMVADPGFATQGLARGFDEVEVWPRQTPAALIIADAQRFIVEHAREPFLLYLHLNDPLQPFNPPRPVRERFVAAAELTRFGLTPPFSVSSRGEVRGCDRCGGAGRVNSAFLGLVSDLYDAEVAGLDEQLAPLFDLLSAADLVNRTVVVVTGTHGELLWDRDHRFGHPTDDLSDAVVRVPLIIKPAGASAAKRVQPQVRTMDLFATLLDLAGAPPAVSPTFSASLAPLLVSSSPSLAVERASMSAAPAAGVFSIRQEGLKLVGVQTGTGGLALALYDLERDPRELRDVAAEHAADVERLLLSALDRSMLARAGSYLLVELPADARTFRLHVASVAPLAAAEALFETPVRLSPSRVAFDVAGPVGPRRWRAFRLATTADAVLDVELTVVGPTPLKVKKKLAAAATPRLASGVLADLASRGQPDVVLVAVEEPATPR